MKVRNMKDLEREMDMDQQPLKANTENKYMESAEGYFVAWSLATPQHSFGEW